MRKMIPKHPQHNQKIVFYVIRHGQTNWNLDDKIQGQTDIPLNNLGIAQAKEIKMKLGDTKFSSCFSSDLKRTSQTAQIIMEGQQDKIIFDRRLRERNFRELEGKSSSAYICATSQDLKNIETDDAVSRRVFEFLHEVLNTKPIGNILIVTHGGVIRSILTKILALKCRDVEIETGNMAMIKLLFANDSWKVLELTDIHWPKG